MSDPAAATDALTSLLPFASPMSLAGAIVIAARMLVPRIRELIRVVGGTSANIEKMLDKLDRIETHVTPSVRLIETVSTLTNAVQQLTAQMGIQRPQQRIRKRIRRKARANG